MRKDKQSNVHLCKQMICKNIDKKILVIGNKSNIMLIIFGVHILVPFLCSRSSFSLEKICF